MKALFQDFRSAVMAVIVLAVVCCGIYPLLVYGVAQAAFQSKANGSLLYDKTGTNVIGSSLLGQQFTGIRYFHSRPSAAGNGYDGLNSGGSNLGPTSEKLRDAIRDRIAEYRKVNRLNEGETVPADAVTASASGLDPHISPRNAALQAARVARVRSLGIDRVMALVHAHTTTPGLGVLGDPGVNVLELNLALDAGSEEISK